ncbi:MAG: DUF3570 domain-containing protein [Nitrosomonas sp.]|nr:DUF3570 domain-containing protein [Nitrosomonas sp.]MDP1950277.1 DUF3570 domain-containing protein [Nitrosomonas sp.]
MNNTQAVGSNKQDAHNRERCNSNPTTSPVKNGALQALTAAALVLPGLVLSTVEASNVSTDSFSFQYSRFQEGKRNLFTVPNNLKPIEAEVIHASGNLLLTDRVKFSYNYSRDTWAGATPVTTAPLAANGNRPILKNTADGLVTAGASPFVNTQILLDRQLNPIRQDPLTGQVIGKDTRAVEILSSASPETRNAADFKLGYEWNEAAVDFGGGISVEKDFNSSYGNVSGRLDFNQKLTSLKFGSGYSSSTTSAILDHDLVPYLTKTAYLNQIESRGGSEILHGSRQDWMGNVGLTQILGKSSLLNANIGYTHSAGFMENPYKAMTVIFVDPESFNNNLDTPIVGNVRALIEQRPDIRNQVAISSQYIQHIRPLDAALHLNYKFSFDDWGINTNTFVADWVQPLGSGWSLTPRVRYYSQEAANFYQPFLFSRQAFSQNAVDASGREIWVDANNPNVQYVRDNNFNLLDGEGKLVNESLLNVQPKSVPFNANKLPDNFSSDHRLSGYGSLSGGVTLNKQLVRGVELQAGFEYYTRASTLKLGGSGGTSFADFDFYVANAVIKVNVEQFNFMGGGSSSSGSGAHQGHSVHKHHHGGQIPAGIMYGHMLDKAGDVMVGYRFMHSRQAGDILQGTRVVSDQTVVDQGCSDALNCRFVPTYMNMNMHMLEVMYAPTHWLNVMLMPSFVDMGMNIRGLSGRSAPVPGVHEHTGIAGHATGGVGDTNVTSLIKLYTAPGHWFHLGLGFSAPTGDVGRQFRRVFQIDGGIAHFDMQLGSGTWDFLPSLTYTGEHDRWTWGAQLYGVKRMEDQNKSGYRLGDLFQATTWGGYRLMPWLSATVRGIYTGKDTIRGDFNVFNGRIGPQDFPSNSGGRFWDVGLGLNASIPRGKYAGNRLSFEWLQPIQDDVNGYQLERKGALAATWNYSF